MPLKNLPQARSALDSGRDPQTQHLNEILQMAEDLDVPLTMDELLMAIQGEPQTQLTPIA